MNKKHSADTSHLCFTAIQAALKAGELLKTGFNSKYAIHSKPGIHNLVTEYDLKAEECIISMIREQFPDHSFLAEESGDSNSTSSSITWVIDPLDGTVNFAHNIPFFSVSIAACTKDETLCGVVYQPMTQELFIAEKGRGSYLNGARLQVSETREIEKSILATGFPYNLQENPLKCIDVFSSVALIGMPIRRLGSAALDISYVAAGRFDGFWEVVLHPWDLAAAKLILEEAGGKLTHYDGKKHPIFTSGTVLATNSLIHEKMVSLLS
ncbi:MAG: inositol monophosphatase [Chlamydiales bacterium]|nr:inositol monophosphatase [Chlamydiales bacterium]